jgi:hypothetical protein
MAISGVLLLMARYKALNFAAAEAWEAEYKISTQQPQPVIEELVAVEVIEEPKAPRVKKVSKPATKAVAVKKASASKAKTKTPAPKKKPVTRTKKSSE